jgi:hypothetical protein
MPISPIKIDGAPGIHQAARQFLALGTGIVEAQDVPATNVTEGSHSATLHQHRPPRVPTHCDPCLEQYIWPRGSGRDALVRGVVCVAKLLAEEYDIIRTHYDDDGGSMSERGL